MDRSEIEKATERMIANLYPGDSEAHAKDHAWRSWLQKVDLSLDLESGGKLNYDSFAMADLRRWYEAGLNAEDAAQVALRVFAAIGA